MPAHTEPSAPPAPTDLADIGYGTLFDRLALEPGMPLLALEPVGEPLEPYQHWVLAAVIDEAGHRTALDRGLCTSRFVPIVGETPVLV